MVVVRDDFRGSGKEPGERRWQWGSSVEDQEDGMKEAHQIDIRLGHEVVVDLVVEESPEADREAKAVARGEQCI